MAITPLPVRDLPSEAANPKATAKIMLNGIASPKRAMFLDDNPMVIVYIEAASVTV